MNATTWTRRGLTLLVAALTVLCLLPAPPARAVTGDHLIVAGYQPAGYENLSHMIYEQYGLEASSHGTFFQLNEAQTAPLYDWDLNWLCDDDLDAGWSTAFDEGVTDPATPAWATIDLGKRAQLRRVVLFPARDEAYAAHFPRALEIRLSDDKEQWTTVYTNDTVNASVDAPLVVDLTKLPTARYVQVYVTRRTDTPMTTDAGETLPVQIGEMAVFGTETIMSLDDFDSYKPAGCETLSQEKAAAVSSGAEGAALTDLDLSTSWAAGQEDAAPWACVDLEAPYVLRRVVLFPHPAPYGEGFPSSYRVEISEEGESWITLHEAAGGAAPDQPVVIELSEPTAARYVRVSAGQGEALKLAELAVFGEAPEARVDLDRTALELTPGDTDQLKATLVSPNALPLTQKIWTTSDERVVTVDAEGRLTAVGVGEADITVTNQENGLDISASCHVYVVASRRDPFQENILISMFWPPIGPDYITEEQYKWMADAGINYVMGAGEEVDRKEDQLKMLQWCYKYGMRMTVGDGRLGPSLSGKSREYIAGVLAEYKNVPGVGGYWLCDEPASPLSYVDAYQAIKSLDPDKYVYLNFLPGVSADVIDEWLKQNASSGYPCDYYLYDFYPFRADGQTATQTMLQLLETGRKAGLANGVKTGTFIQSMGIDGVYRLPTQDEIRWETSIALGFGYKYLSYFTWFQPPSGSEAFTGSIISRDGQKTALYGAVSDINHQILSMGPTLVNLDALEVYFNGETYDGTVASIPQDFFAQPLDGANFQVTLMRHKGTGRNYLMAVNNSFTDRAAIALRQPRHRRYPAAFAPCAAGAGRRCRAARPFDPPAAPAPRTPPAVVPARQTAAA